MKKIKLSILAVVVCIALSACSWQQVFEGEKEGFIQNEIQKQQHETNSDISSAYNQIDTSNWKLYTNNKYGYSIKYPTNVIKEGNDSSVRFVNNEGVELVIYKSELKAGENIDETLEQHLKRFYDYYIDQALNHDGNELYAKPYDIKEYSSYEINGYPAYKTNKPISMDSENAGIFVKLGKNIFNIQYVEANGNFKDFTEKSLPTIYKMLSTLTVVTK